MPPAWQAVAAEVLDRIRKRVGELTVNVQALPSLQRAANGGEFIELVVERLPGVASTRDGRYFLRVGDTCQPVLGDDVLRLANERPGRPWEAMDSGVPRNAADAGKLVRFVADIRSSGRVKDSVKEKSDAELAVRLAGPYILVELVDQAKDVYLAAFRRLLLHMLRGCYFIYS